jgi:hypothetical protein
VDHEPRLGAIRIQHKQTRPVRAPTPWASRGSHGSLPIAPDQQPRAVARPGERRPRTVAQLDLRLGSFGRVGSTAQMLGGPCWPRS